MADILARDSEAWIVTLDGTHPSWRMQLQQRWAAAHPILCARVIFHPRLPETRFKHLVCNMDVLLDPPHFGGGNTFYEAVAQGIPTVTWPGHFFRGRIAHGLYRLSGIADVPVVDDLADYAETAVRLAHDQEWRARLRTAFQNETDALFDDAAAVTELGAFFKAAADARHRGEKVTAWRYPRIS
jgi:predicted O-linked N-acetylglucosamine transferase (SPINDLY family)